MAVQTVQTTSDIPKILEPYYVGKAAEGKPGEAGYKAAIPGLIERAYQVYSPDYQTRFGAGLQAAGLEGAGRIAGMSPFQTQVGTQLAGMTTPGQFAAGTQYGMGAGDVFGTMTGLQAPTVGIGSITGQGVLGAYMSPYQQAVTDIQKQSAVTDAQKANLAQNLGAARQGTYGGARQLLATTEREKALQGQLGQIQATGLQSAYNAALNQFNQENQLGLQAQQANQGAALQAAQQRLSAGQGLAGLAGTMGQLGTVQQAADIDRLKTMGAYGDLQRGIQQQQIDTQYQDLMTRLNYPETQLSSISNILRGIPTTDNTKTATTPAPSFASQLAGMGLAGLSLYNMFQPSGGG
jgi:hypothetical protein